MHPERLTIAFPTYMRRSAILARLSQLLSDRKADALPVLVIDNGSSDGTYDAVAERFETPRLTVRRNSTNVGIVRNLTRLIRECRTEYLLMMSDEDDLITDHLPELLELLEQKHPLFVSPQAIIDGKVYRGAAATGPILPTDFHTSSFYISGLVYHVPSTLPLVGPLEALEPVSTSARIYPLGTLAVQLMLMGEVYWLGQPIAVKREGLPSLIFDEGGDDYRHLPSRWRQYVDFQSFLGRLCTAYTDVEALGKLAEMRAALDRGLYDRIAKAIEWERPASADAFRSGARRREGADSTQLAALNEKLENFRGMIKRRDDKIARLEAKRVAD